MSQMREQITSELNGLKETLIASKGQIDQEVATLQQNRENAQ